MRRFVAGRVSGLVAALAIAVGCAWPSPSLAAPGHKLGDGYCYPSLKRWEQYPPAVMYSSYATSWHNPQIVWWRPYLYRYNYHRRHYYLAERGYWAWAAADSYGLYRGAFQNTWHADSGGGILFEPFTGLSHGTYTVLNRLTWPSWGSINAWDRGYCKM